MDEVRAELAKQEAAAAAETDSAEGAAPDSIPADPGVDK